MMTFSFALTYTQEGLLSGTVPAVKVNVKSFNNIVSINGRTRDSVRDVREGDVNDEIMANRGE
jgi:hypothetical protein